MIRRVLASFIALLVLLLAGATSQTQSLQPVDGNASKEARQLLSYLYEINGEHILSGQYNYNRDFDEFTERAHEITGKYPTVWSTDFIFD